MDFSNYTSLVYLLSSPVLAAFLATTATRLNVLRKLTSQAEKGKVAYTQEQPPVSIVLTCHNQGTQLEENLPLLLEQDYPAFQVIVVNDCSTDHSEDVLKELSLRYPNLYHTFTPVTARYVSHQKLALTIGIKAAKYDWILLTEADCKPAGNQWIQKMARNFTPAAQAVIGYANYGKEKGFFNSLAAYDRLIENIRTLGTVILNDHAFRGESCNMAIRKSTFLENRGYQKNLFLKRGEETFLINEIARPGNTRVELSPESRMVQEMPFNKKVWKNDKVYDVETRHYTRLHDRIADWYLGTVTFLSWFFYLLVLGEIIISVLTQNWVLLGVNILICLLYLSWSSWQLHKSTTALGERNYGFSRLFLEPVRVLQNCVCWLKWLFTRKDFFLRR